MRDSLGEAKPLTFIVNDEDIALHGSLAGVQHEVDLARENDFGTAKVDLATPARTKARINALFARHDAAFAEKRHDVEER